MVGALEETGAIGEVADGIASITDGDRTAELLGITWVSAIGSAIVDNIPFTTTMIPVVEQLQSGNDGDDAYWWALALGACFGGNATLVAAAANVAASGMAARAGKPIGFVEFLQVGRPGDAGLDDPGDRLHRRALPLRSPPEPRPSQPRPRPRGARRARGRHGRGRDPGDPGHRPARAAGRRPRRRLKGIFGEREFMAALFPGYVGELKYAGFVKHGLDDAIERRAACRNEPVAKYMNTEHIDVGETSPTSRSPRPSCTTAS